MVLVVNATLFHVPAASAKLTSGSIYAVGNPNPAPLLRTVHGEPTFL